ncbi:MAG: hypothetical protein ACK5JS_00785 [Mangrovibacterium sp.]
MATKAQIQLRTRIKQLKSEQTQQRKELTVVLKDVAQDFQSGNFIKQAVHSLLRDTNLQKDFLSTITPIVTSFISGTVMRKTKHTKIRLLTAIGQLGINGITSTYGDTIQKYVKAYAKVGKSLFTKK